MILQLWVQIPSFTVESKFRHIELALGLDSGSVFDSRSERESNTEQESRLNPKSWEATATYKCQHSSSLASSIKKRIFEIDERVPLTTPRIDPGTSNIIGERLTTWSTQASLKMEVHLVPLIVDAAIALRLQCAHQGYNSISWFLKTFFFGK